MNSENPCGNCYQYYNSALKKIKLKCKDEICFDCYEEMKINTNPSCPICKKRVEISDTNILQDEDLLSEDEPNTNNERDSSNFEESSNMKADIEYCRVHPEKQIEYFCKSCSKVVCVTCIYTHHNGHHLSLFNEVTNNIKLNLRESGRMLENIIKINKDNLETLDMRLEEIKNINKHQIVLVEKSFAEIHKKLDDKKNEVLKEFEK